MEEVPGSNPGGPMNYKPNKPVLGDEVRGAGDLLDFSDRYGRAMDS